MPGLVNGYVRDDITWVGIYDVRVFNQWDDVRTASDGFYSIYSEDGTFNLTAERDKSKPPDPIPTTPPPYYYGKTYQVTVNNNTMHKDFLLHRMP